jgi:hypothetical protein
LKHDFLAAIDESNSYATISNETKSLERFTDSFVYKDFVRQGLIASAFASSRSTIRTATTTSLTSTVSSSIPSNINDNNGNNHGQILINTSNGTNTSNVAGMNTLVMVNTLLPTHDDSFRISHINRNFGFCRR